MGGVLQVENVWPEVAAYLPDDLVYKISNNKCYSLVHEYNAKVTYDKSFEKFVDNGEVPKSEDSYYERRISIVRYLGCRSTNKAKGIKKLANIMLRAHQEFGFMKALAPPMMIPFADGSSAFLFYAAFEKDPIGKMGKWEFKEGELPPNLPKYT